MSQTSPASANPELEATYDLLAEIVLEADARGVNPTAAQAKTRLRDRFQGFDEKSYGFSKFLDYLTEGATTGKFQLFRDEQGHPRLLAKTKTLTADDVSELHAIFGPQNRLRSDLWAAFVTWGDRDHRFWDRTDGRAIFVPLNEEGAPLWFTEPLRFAEISPVTMKQQMDWMRAFAAEQSEEGPSCSFWGLLVTMPALVHSRRHC
ncbi:hypothetical protein [Arthrobacter sp. StoSoilB13]|uniref:hypothetical protein n=1 Tax=Arthrobacter sp. StoSoilB13 TaxID=2830993 RepID=UPI001CC34B84|nr:hypothetical protein [Arthrobacter sp. StoSoilB13]BCW47979.1 hypothetical protein StoSoilB13_03210 [Arthrobacter sp. StoSoilB13]